MLLNSLCSECVTVTNLSYHLFIFSVNPVPYFEKKIPYKSTYVLVLIPVCLASACSILFVFVVVLYFILFIPLTIIIHLRRINKRPRISNDSSTICCI